MALCFFLTSGTERRTIGVAAEGPKVPGLRGIAPDEYAAAPGLPVLPRTRRTRGVLGFLGSRGLDGAAAYSAALALGGLSAPGSSEDVAFRTSSANLRWLASSCS